MWCILHVLYSMYGFKCGLAEFANTYVEDLHVFHDVVFAVWRNVPIHMLKTCMCSMIWSLFNIENDAYISYIKLRLRGSRWVTLSGASFMCAWPCINVTFIWKCGLAELANTYVEDMNVIHDVVCAVWRNLLIHMLKTCMWSMTPWFGVCSTSKTMLSCSSFTTIQGALQSTASWVTPLILDCGVSTYKHIH